MNDADDWRAKRARYERFIATELGRLYRAYDHATIEYWKNDGNDSISDRKLEQLDNAAREAADAFVAKLMELAGIIEPPYRSGDSDKVTRSPTWPRADDAKKRIEVMIDGRAADNVTIDVVDLIVVMREIGRLTPENAKLVAALKTLRVRLASLPDTCAIIDAALAAGHGSGK